jgi:hypothetical protein
MENFEQYLNSFTDTQLKLICSLLHADKTGNNDRLVTNIISTSKLLDEMEYQKMTYSTLHSLYGHSEIKKTKKMIIDELINDGYHIRIESITNNKNHQYIVQCSCGNVNAHYFTNIIYNKNNKDRLDYCDKCKSYITANYHDNLFFDSSFEKVIINQELENTRSFCKYLHDKLLAELKLLCTYFKIYVSGKKSKIVQKLIKLTTQKDLQIIINQNKTRCALVECIGPETHNINHVFFSNEVCYKNILDEYEYYYPYENHCETCGKLCIMHIHTNLFFDPNAIDDKPNVHTKNFYDESFAMRVYTNPLIEPNMILDNPISTSVVIKPITINPSSKINVGNKEMIINQQSKINVENKEMTINQQSKQIIDSSITSISQLDQKSNREKIPATIRNIVWNKYIGTENKKGLCFCCSLEDISFANFHCGHMISVKNGGPTIVDNLRPICGHCNTSIGAKNMIEFIEKYGIDSRSNINMLTNKLNQISTANVIPIATKEIKSIVWIKYACGKQNKKCFMGCDTVLLKDTFKCGYLRLNNDDGTNFRPLCDDCYDITKEHGISHFAKLHDISIVI